LTGHTARTARGIVRCASFRWHQYLNSSDYGSLRGGYWMIYYAGSFTNGRQALAYCGAHGLTTGNQCLGRFVSHNPADRHVLSPGGQPGRRLYRPLTRESPAVAVDVG
jgi:hypothetical protein